MAIKTMIIRPYKVAFDSSYITYNPADYDGDIAELLCEEVADDDSTYVQISKSCKGNILFKYYRPSDAIKIKGVVTHFRYKTGSEEDVTILTDIYFYLENATGNSKYKYIDQSPLGEVSGSIKGSIEYTTIVNGTYETDLIAANLEGVIQGTMYFYISYGDPLAKTITPIKITQLYLEIVYEAEDPEIVAEPIYIRENNSWTELTGKVYQKQNGTWQECGTGILLEGSAKVTT